MNRRSFALLFVFLALAPSATAAGKNPLRVLFLGNSLTYCNDLPALVQAMAAAGGRELTYTQRAEPNYALEDHWTAGARGTLKRGQFDVVVMQQGPSTQPDSRTHLRHWTKKWCEFARAEGTEPVLYMVWPYATQRSGFLLASESYRDAARSNAARVFPAGEAWALAVHANNDVQLYEADALHPTETGSYLAALVIAKGLTGLDPDVVPAKLKLKNGSTVTVDEVQAKLFRAIVKQLRYEDAPAAASASTGVSATAPAATTPASR